MSLLPCKKCGNSSRDQRFGICDRCAFPEKQASMVKYTDRKKLKVANGDMLQYFADHPEKLKAKRERDRAKMKRAQVESFVDEMEKISKGFLQNIGTKITQGARAMMTAPARTMEAGGQFLRNPMQSMRQGWKATWDPSLKQGGGKLTGSLFLAGTGMQAASAAAKQDPTGRGESRPTRVLRAVGSTVGGLAGARHGILPGIALGIGGEELAGFAGRRFDKMRGRVKGPVTAAPGPQIPESV